MGFFERPLRLNQHDDPNVLYEDATLTLTKRKNAQVPQGIALVAAFLQHAPSNWGQLCVAHHIVALREPIEAAYWKEVNKVGKHNPCTGVWFASYAIILAADAPTVWESNEVNANLRATNRLLEDLQALADHYNKAILEPCKFFYHHPSHCKDTEQAAIVIGVKRRIIPENPCWGSKPPPMMGVQSTKRKGMREQASRAFVFPLSPSTNSNEDYRTG